MPRARALSGVATTLARVFVSRNNDAAGYWGVGKLYKFAAARGIQELEINLLPHSGEELEAEDMQIVKQHFQGALQKQLRSAHLAHVPVTEGHIRVQIGVADEKLRGHERFGYGAPIECTVTLKLSSGHLSVATARCRAAPHDPSRESRRYEHAALTIASSRPATPSARPAA